LAYERGIESDFSEAKRAGAERKAKEEEEGKEVRVG
jgi:hypothetical protein